MRHSFVRQACAHRHHACIKLLQKHGAELKLKNEGVELCRVAHVGDLHLIKLLLDAGASATAADYDGRTAMHLAVCEGNMPLVRLLIEHAVATKRPTVKAMCSIEDRWGRLPVDDARVRNYVDMIVLLETSRNDGVGITRSSNVGLDMVERIPRPSFTGTQLDQVVEEIATQPSSGPASSSALPEMGSSTQQRFSSRFPPMRESTTSNDGDDETT